jgi:hypothetical protein
MTFEKLLEKHGKYCPYCGSGQLTTKNNEHPLWHQCLDCDNMVKDADVITGKAAAEAQTPKKMPLPDYGDLMTLEDFKEQCEQHAFIDYDGSGYYAFADSVTRIRANPSDFAQGKVRAGFTHVMWFNK